MEFLDVVNGQDEVVGRASKKEVYRRLLTHRIVHIFVFNDKGEMALQLQSRHKAFCPLHWVSAAAGHVKAGESYQEAAARELKEEVGIEKDVSFAHKDLYQNGGLKKMIATFVGQFNGPFKIRPEEVERIEFFSLEKVKEMMSSEKFHPELLFLLKRHFDI